MTNEWFLITYLVLWVLVIGLIVLVLALYRELGQLYLRTGRGVARDGPRIGAALPFVPATGGQIDLSSGRHVLLFGLDSCPICEDLVPRLAELASRVQLPFGLHVLVTGSGGDAPERPPWASGSRLDVRSGDAEVTRKLGIRVSPFALYVVNGAVSAKSVVNTPQQVFTLAGAALEGVS